MLALVCSLATGAFAKYDKTKKHKKSKQRTEQTCNPDCILKGCCTKSNCVKAEINVVHLFETPVNCRGFYLSVLIFSDRITPIVCLQITSLSGLRSGSGRLIQNLIDHHWVCLVFQAHLSYLPAVE